jgi:hypothetical protein
VKHSEQPPAMDYFARARSALGTTTIALRLDPLQLEIGGLDDDLARVLRERYAPYAAPAADGADVLRIRVVADERDHFIPPGEPMALVQIRIACDGDRVRYMSHRIAGWFDTLGGEGLAVMGRTEYQTKPRAIENFVRAAVAWQAACRGGALVHAASAVWQGSGFLFYGESGAGKSTLAACNRRARIVSDDLSLVLPDADGRLLLTGSPFRGTYEGGEPVVGRFPVAAGFRLIKAERAAVRAVGRVQALSELVGNLPFVADKFVERPDLFQAVERAFAPVPLAHLHFRKDDTYWDAIEAAGL